MLDGTASIEKYLFHEGMQIKREALGHFFAGGSRADILKKLIISLISKPSENSISFLVGSPGIGKSTLLTQLAGRLDSVKISYAYIQICSSNSSEEFFIKLLKVLQPSEDYEERLNKLSVIDQKNEIQRSLKRKLRENPFFLLIDDINHQPTKQFIELLDLCSIFFNGEHKFMIVASSDRKAISQFERYIPSDREVIPWNTIHIPMLNADEAEDYLLFRLTVLGLEDNAIFNNHFIQNIRRYTYGIPKRIEAAVKRSLDQRIGQAENWLLSPSFYPTVAFVLCIAIIVTWFFLPSPELFSKESSTTLSSNDQKDFLKYQESFIGLMALDTTSDIVNDEDAELALFFRRYTPNTQPSEPYIDDRDINKLDIGKTTLKSSPNNTLIASNTDGWDINKALKENYDWIKEQDKNNYTIQILGSTSISKVLSYIESKPFPREFAFYVRKRNEENWFSVIYGSFPSEREALVASNAIAPLLHSSPWVRSFESISHQIESE